MTFEKRVVEVTRKEGIVERIVGWQEDFIYVLGKDKGAFSGLSLVQLSQHFILYTVRVGYKKRKGMGQDFKQRKRVF